VISEEGLEEFADALAELAIGLWQQEQHKQRTAAEAATSADEPESATEATYTGNRKGSL
jgi:hypothetical protein